MPNLFFYFWTALIGLCLGSFTNVLILRDRERSSIVAGRSHCPHCEHLLAWFDLIPVVSFLILQGKCRYCHKTISWQYPLVELVTSVLIAGSVWYGYGERGSILLAIAFSVAAILLVTVSVIDLRTMELPLEYVVLAGLIAAGTRVLVGELDLSTSLLGLLAGAGSVAVVLYGWKWAFKQEGMGVGDIWLAGAVGAIVGYPLIWVSLMAAVFSGALVGSILVAFQKKQMDMAMPFGPFLVLGLLIALVWGQSLWQWYILMI